MSCMKDLTFRDAQVEFFDPLCVASNPVLIKVFFLFSFHLF